MLSLSFDNRVSQLVHGPAEKDNRDNECSTLHECFKGKQCRHVIPALNAWQPWQHNKRMHARLPPSFLGMDAGVT